MPDHGAVDFVNNFVSFTRCDIALFHKGVIRNSLGVELFLNNDALWTMRELIEADLSHGLFSYSAAIISDGIKLYEPFDSPPLKGWLVRQPKGNFDERLFAAQLEAMY
jgi:hypothetical protein